MRITRLVSTDSLLSPCQAVFRDSHNGTYSVSRARLANRLYWSSDFCSSNRSLQTPAPNNVMVILIASPMKFEYPMIEPSGGIRTETGPIEFRERLGGMLRSYYREAA